MSDDSNDIMAELDALLEDIEQPESENELVALSQSFPLWQRDALRRIAQHGKPLPRQPSANDPGTREKNCE